MTALSPKQQAVIKALIEKGLNSSQVASIEAAANKALGRPVMNVAEGGLSTNKALNLANLQSMLAGNKEHNLAFDANGDGKLSIQDTISFLKNTQGLPTPGQEDFFNNIYNPQEETAPPARTMQDVSKEIGDVGRQLGGMAPGTAKDNLVKRLESLQEERRSLGQAKLQDTPPATTGTPPATATQDSGSTAQPLENFSIVPGSVTMGGDPVDNTTTTPPATTTVPPATTGTSGASVGTLGGPVYDESGNLVGNLGSAGPMFDEQGLETTTGTPPATTGTPLDQPGNPLTGQPYGGKDTDPVTGLPINAAELLPNTGAATVNPALNVNPNDPQGLATTVVKLPEGATTAVAGGTTPSTLDQQTNAVFNPESGTFTSPSTIVAPTGTTTAGTTTGDTTIDPGFDYAADDTTTTETTQQTDQERLGEEMFRDNSIQFYGDFNTSFNPKDEEGNTFAWTTPDQINEEALKTATPEQVAMYDLNGNGEIDVQDVKDLRLLEEYNRHGNLADDIKPQYPKLTPGLGGYSRLLQALKMSEAKGGIPSTYSKVLDPAVLQKALAEKSVANVLDPTGSVTKQDVTKVDSTDPGQYVDKDTGQIGAVDSTSAVQGSTTTAKTPDDIAAEKVAAAKSAEDVADVTKDVTAAKGEVSEDAKVTAAQGELSEGAIADAATMNPEFVDEVTSGTRSVSSEELAKAQGLDEEAVKANIAEAEVPDNIKSAQGTVKENEIPKAAEIKESDMAQAEAITADGLSDDAIAVAAKLEKFSVDDQTLAEFKEGKIEAQDTVQGQLAKLMKDFDDGTPAWAAGAIRAANAAMASRGMGGSSMAGSAILQAAMESALPIASEDAQAFRTMKLDNLNRQQQVSLANAAAQQGVKIANFNAEQQVALQNSQNAFSLQTQNLSNMQQTVIANAQIKATLQGQNLSNQQQANMAEAARYAEMSNINLNNRQQGILQDNANEMQVNLANASAKQQAYIANAQIAAALQGKKIDNQQQVAIANAARFAEANNLSFTAAESAKIHNSNLLKTIGIAELNAKQSAVLQNAASIASMDMANLSNRQQANVKNAQAFLDMDLANLSNEQQTSLFKAKANVDAVFNDQAAENSARQFNATSENQTNQFLAKLEAEVSIANAAQMNAMEIANVSEVNGMAKFNTDVNARRDEAMATNAIIVAQANAEWRQKIATKDADAQNLANANDAQALNDATENAIDQIWQRERDIMDYAFRSSESSTDRAVQIILQRMTGDSLIEAAAFQAEIAAAQSEGGLLGDIFGWVTGIKR